jgi:hypothetical protein
MPRLRIVFTSMLVTASSIGCMNEAIVGDEPEIEFDAQTRAGTTIFIPGTTTTPAGVDPKKTYTPSRSLRTLDVAARLTPEERAVLWRADGMIKSQPADSRVSIEELAQLGAPSFQQVLTPAERAAYAGAWRVMVAPAITAMPPIRRPAELVQFDTRNVRVTRSAGTELVRPEPRTRFSLIESGDHALAQRIQYGYDDDGDPLTISLDDLDAAAKNKAYTPAEVAGMKAMIERLRALADGEADRARDATPRSLLADVRGFPLPGTRRAVALRLPELEVHTVEELTYRESRVRRGPGTTIADDDFFEYKLQALQTWTYTIKPTAGYQIVHLEPYKQVDLGPTTEPVIDPTKTWAYEIWKDGAPIKRLRLTAHRTSPEFVTERTLDISQFRGHDLHAANDGEEWPLVGLLIDGHAPSVEATQRWTTRELRVSPSAYWRTSIEPPTTRGMEDGYARLITESNERALLSPERQLRVAPGVYSFEVAGTGTIQITVYPQGAVIATVPERPAPQILVLQPTAAGALVGTSRSGIALEVASKYLGHPERYASSLVVRVGTRSTSLAFGRPTAW